MRRQRNMAKMREQIKAPEKEPKLNAHKQSIECRVQTLVIRMLRELNGYFNSMKKTQAEMKVTLSEIKKNPQGNSEGKDAGIQINYLEVKEEINIQSEQKEEKELKRTRIV